MGCFWSPDALFGAMAGVVRTRVGYAGGTTATPTYWALADHMETLQLDFNPGEISYADLLHVFFANHNPTKPPWKRQYTSAVFYHTPAQEALAWEHKRQLEANKAQQVYTAIYPFKEFFLAEVRHQKYKLQRQPDILGELQELYPETEDLLNTTAAARVNGYLYGYGSKEQLLHEVSSLGLSPAAQEVLLRKAGSRRQISCAG